MMKLKGDKGLNAFITFVLVSEFIGSGDIVNVKLGPIYVINAYMYQTYFKHKNLLGENIPLLVRF